MGKKINDTVTWVGKVDWELRHFHGDEYETHRGSSYNSFLIRDKKTVLIDTVWKPFDGEFVSKLKEEIDLNTLDYIVALHGEVDHAGSLAALMRELRALGRDVPIYCTANGVKSLRGQYHSTQGGAQGGAENWRFIPVKTGDKLELGAGTLTFVEAPMLHWPDTLMAYLDSEKILFSSDGFGQHLASESLYADTVDPAELEQEALKYFANILSPFCPMVTKKINEILAMNLPVETICTAHGVLWRENGSPAASPSGIIAKYLEWAGEYKENQITLLYDTMWNNTRLMAEAIAEGLRQADPGATVKLFNAAQNDKSDLITEIFRSRAVLMGSSTVNNGYLYAVAGMLELMKGARLKGKKAAAFGSYGWSGEAVKLIGEALSHAGFEVVDDGIRVNWTPDDAMRETLRAYGRELAPKLK